MAMGRNRGHMAPAGPTGNIDLDGLALYIERDS